MPNTLCLNVNFPLKKFSNSSFYRFLFLPTIWLNPFFHFLCRCYWWSSLYLSSAGVLGSPCLLRVPTYLKNTVRVPTKYLLLESTLGVPTTRNTNLKSQVHAQLDHLGTERHKGTFSKKNILINWEIGYPILLISCVLFQGSKKDLL